MKYKNLNTLGRAYRNGEVDRSGYIRQRREIIDAITTRELDAQDSRAPSEQTTVISDAQSLAGEADDDEDDNRRHCAVIASVLKTYDQSAPHFISGSGARALRSAKHRGFACTT